MEPSSGETKPNTYKDEQPNPPSTLPKTPPDAFVGRHRMTAAISHLHNKINYIQKELEMLQTAGESSSLCQELVRNVESLPDPLLPSTIGPVDVGWERWFRGPHSSRRRWI